MKSFTKIGIALLILAILVGAFGLWLKEYGDKITQVQINETGTCYLSDGTCMHTTTDFILFITLGIAVILAVTGIYLIIKKPQRIIVKKTVEKHVIEKKEPIPEATSLSPESRQIFDIITQSNGAILQGDLVEKSGMDKVRVSRILNKLEMLGLIERRRHGMSNLVVLKSK